MTFGLIEILIVVAVFLVLGPRRIADLFRSVAAAPTTSWTTWGATRNRKNSKTRKTRTSPPQSSNSSDSAPQASHDPKTHCLMPS
jgi:Sec-independent protein translocase protein TatA